MNTMIAFISNTPWWVYLLFFYLVSRGFAASHAQTVSLKRLVILPILLSIWSLSDLAKLSPVSNGLIVIFCLSFCIGLYFGWQLVANQNIEIANRAKFLLKLPGTWSTLTLVLIIFVTKYYFGFETSTHPNWIHHTLPEYSLFCVSALSSGLLCGRLMNYIYRFKQ